MPYWSGTIYDAGTLTANGNSGWISLPVIGPIGGGIQKALLRLEPADLATDETLDLDLNVAFDSSGNGDVKLLDFTQVTATNAPQNVVLPGGEEGVGWIELGTNAGILAAPLPPYWKLAWTLGGTTKSMTFVLYGVLYW